MVKLVNLTVFVAKIKAKKLNTFTARDLRLLFGFSQRASEMLVFRYAKKGLIIRLKRGLYALADYLPIDEIIANKLRTPSYISLEYALSYYGVIPETVYEITSVTTKSARRFKVLGKEFSFRKIKTAAFSGYLPKKINDEIFLIAEPEKAFVDLCYLRMLDGLPPMSRFTKEKINYDKAMLYVSLFQNLGLSVVVKKILS